jgi:hypothetical protein
MTNKPIRKGMWSYIIPRETHIPRIGSRQHSSFEHWTPYSGGESSQLKLVKAKKSCRKLLASSIYAVPS